ncbi:MAG TPA: GNAT family N-acetyltransferase [Acidimicrobiales bacterium]|nr:GNAT family N-acetyltransferase [Acidimicrobiales bacterium]
MVHIVTPRLELVAAEPPIAQAEADGVQGWCAPLDVEPPGSWPPPLNEHATLAWFADAITKEPEAIGWFAWYVLCRRPRALIGQAGFKGRPDDRGTVELGYSLLPSSQGRGFGTELVRALTMWAFSHEAVDRVMADTYPEFVSSVRVLEKNRFTLNGRADEPGAVRYELRRSMVELTRQ